MFVQRIIKSDFLIIFVASAIHGGLATLSMAPFNIPLMAWIAPWPLFYFSKRFQKEPWKLIAAGALSAFFLCVFAFHWILITFHVFAGMGWIPSLLVFVPYALLLNLKLPLFVLTFGIFNRHTIKKYFPTAWFTAAGIALFTDFITPQIFPWYWGNLLGGNEFISQVAEFTGVYGLSFILFGGSYFFYRMVFIIRHCLSSSLSRGVGFKIAFSVIWRIFRRWNRLFPVPLLILSVLLFGIIRKNQLEELQRKLPTIRVAAIQPATPLPESGKIIITRKIISNLFRRVIPGLTATAAKSAAGSLDLIILPESAIPYFSTDDTPYTRASRIYSEEFKIMAQLIAYNWNTELFLNEITISQGINHLGKMDGLPYNSSVLFSRKGERVAVYHKQLLLAFGEYIPGLEILKATGLINLVPGIIKGSRFYPGNDATLIPYSVQNRKNPFKYSEPLLRQHIPDKKAKDFVKEFPPRKIKWAGYFMPLICYEVISPEIVASFFKNQQGRNPDFIVNIANDGWYGNSIETFQHFELGRIRSIETRRSLVRTVNKGAAGAIDIVGNYIVPIQGPILTSYELEDFQIWDIPLNRNMKTFYTRFGNKWIFILLFLFVFIGALKTISRNRRKRK